MNKQYSQAVEQLGTTRGGKRPYSQLIAVTTETNGKDLEENCTNVT